MGTSENVREAMSRLIADEDELFERLRLHLNKMGAGLPEKLVYNSDWNRETAIEAAKAFYSAEDAVLVLELPIEPGRSVTAAEVATKLGLDEKYVEGKLYELSVKGRAYRFRENQETRYRCVPLAFGAVEWGIGLLKNEATRPDFMKVLQAFSLIGADIMAMPGMPMMRFVPNKPGYANDPDMADYDNIEKIIESKSRIAVNDCFCRACNPDPCSRTRECCFMLDDYADFCVENGIGRYITYKEAMELLDRLRDENMIFQLLNSKSPEVICCCCGKHCGTLNIFAALPDSAMNPLVSNYVAAANLDRCIKCGKCDVCETGAISYDEEGAVVHKEVRCVGCGICTEACPNDVFSLVRRPNHYVPYDDYFTYEYEAAASRGAL